MPAKFLSDDALSDIAYVHTVVEMNEGLTLSTYGPKVARFGVKYILSKPYAAPELLKMLEQVLASVATASKANV